MGRASSPYQSVSSMNCGPRGANGASPFMNAQPECDIDSTPAANPTLIAPTWIAGAREIAALSEEAQKRFIVIAGTFSGNPAASAAHRATSP